MKSITLDGHTYTKDELKEIRQQVIGWRDESMKQWPDAIPFTVTATHLIGILHHMIEQYPE